MRVLGVPFDFSGSIVRGVSFGDSSFEEGQQKSPQELEAEATKILQENGFNRNGTPRKHGKPATDAFLQSKFEGRMWNAGFRGASRKNR